jgi:uncharacterized membrane protein YcaP (DUF421 family)
MGISIKRGENKMWNIVYQYILTPILIFTVSFLFLRIAGKKAVAEMNSFDLLFIIVLGTIVSEPLVTQKVPQALTYGLSIVLIYLLFSIATLNNKLRWILIASPTVLIRNGDIDEKGLRKSRMTISELLAELRTKGYTNPSEVDLAMLEDTGEFSVIPKSTHRPLQPSDLNIQPSPTFIPIPVVMDGQIIDHNLKYLDKDRDWLELQLKANGLSMDKIDKVTLAIVNQKGFIEIDNDYPKDNEKGANSYKPGNEN